MKMEFSIIRASSASMKLQTASPHSRIADVDAVRTCTATGELQYLGFPL
jgi:hypothetical protein